MGRTGGTRMKAKFKRILEKIYICHIDEEGVVQDAIRFRIIPKIVLKIYWGKVV